MAKTPLQVAMIEFFTRIGDDVGSYISLDGLRVNTSPEGFKTINVQVIPDARLLQDLAKIEERAAKDRLSKGADNFLP
jgi:hypothetical protein